MPLCTLEIVGQESAQLEAKEKAQTCVVTLKYRHKRVNMNNIQLELTIGIHDGGSQRC